MPSAADANLPDLAPVILADGDMEDAVEVADASGRAFEKPEGVLHPDACVLVRRHVVWKLVQCLRAREASSPGSLKPGMGGS